MSLFGIGGPVGFGGVNWFDCMVMQSDEDRRTLEEQCETVIKAGVNSDAVILELSHSAQFNSLLEEDKNELIKAIEEMDRMKKEEE